MGRQRHVQKGSVHHQRYESTTKGEDTDVIEYLYENNHLACIEDKPFLYVYIYHGGNTWNLNHFSGIFNASQELFDHSSMINDILDCNYEAIESAGLLKEIPLVFSLT